MKFFLPFYIFLSFLVSCKKQQEAKLEKGNLTNIITYKLINVDQLKGKKTEELRILRNEIFARKGYVFKDSILNNYFLKKEWYKPDKNSEVVLSDIEKENIELIEKIENKLKHQEIPKDYEIVTKSNANGRLINQIIKDIDGDNISDVISLARHKKNDIENVIFIFLSSVGKYKKIKLNSNNQHRIFFTRLEFKNGIIEYDFFEDGTATFGRFFKLKYNLKINKLQLINYDSSYRIMYGHISKEYDLTTGNYKVIEEAARIYDTSKMIKITSEGQQKSKLITISLINEKLYEYLDYIGNEFEEDPYEDLEGKADCRSILVEKLILEFEYGELSYLSGYKVFKKELTDFIKSVNIDEILNSEDNSYSKSYKLHRNWNLEYIKEDECEDELFLIFNINSDSFSIQINNCSVYKEDGEPFEAAEESIMFKYEIGKNCTYKFNRIGVAG